MARFKVPAKSVPIKAARQEHLEARARRVITSDELDAAAHNVLLPLARLLENAPDSARYNEATWGAFQQAAALPSSQAATLLKSLTRSCGKLPANLPSRTALAFNQPGVNRETVALLMQARELTNSLLAAELPSLPRDEIANLLKVVHNEGYYKEQQARIESPTSLLCRSATGPELLDAPRLALLEPGVRRRFSSEERTRNAGREASMPRLTLQDLVVGGTHQALQFLALSGKDLTRGWPELGGETPAQFLGMRSDESQNAYLDRLASKQVFNPFARSFEALEQDAAQMGEANGAAARQSAFLRSKQEPALAPALLLVTTPALFSQAHSPETYKQTLETLMQLCWRVANPNLPFSNPLVSSGIAELRKTHGEQIEKDARLATTVINAEKTRALSGLRDDTYDERLKALLTERGIPVQSDAVAQALGRLVRDVGSDSRALQAALAGVDLKGPEHKVVAKLHALRHDPALYPVAADRTRPLQLGPIAATWPPGDGPILPEIVGATTAGYRVKLTKPHGPFAAGETVLVRVPKGARLTVAPDGRSELNGFDNKRLKETSARLADFEVIERRVRVTERSAVKVGGINVLLEKRDIQSSAADHLRAGRQLKKRDVDALADQYIRGLCDVDPSTRPHGVFYELGPDNYVMDESGIRGSYVDVALMFRTERERGAFGFFQGGYSSAANWIIGDNTPLQPDEVKALWRGEGLNPTQVARRDMFEEALTSRLDPNHAGYRGVPAALRDRVIDELRRDARFLGLSPPAAPPYDEVGVLLAPAVGGGGKAAMEKISKANLSRLRAELGALAPGETELLKRIETFPLNFAHRLTSEKLAAVLDHGGVGTLESMKHQGDVKSATPPAEVKLFNAQNYVFASVGFWTPPHKYGDVVLYVKDRCWQARSWACSKSGYEHFMVAEQKSRPKPLTEEELTYNRYDDPGQKLIEGARRSMRDDSFVPADYASASGLAVLQLLRRRGIDAPGLLKLSDDSMREKLVEVMDDEYLRGRRKVGFLEGKIRDDVVMSEIDRADVPNTKENEGLIRQLQTLGVAVTLLSR